MCYTEKTRRTAGNTFFKYGKLQMNFRRMRYNKCRLYKNTLKEVELKKIGLNTYLDVVYNNSDKKETSSIIDMLYFEKNLYNTYEDICNNDIVFVVRANEKVPTYHEVKKEMKYLLKKAGIINTSGVC